MIEEDRTSMCVSILPGERIVIQDFEIEAQHKSGLRSCLIIRAPRSVRFKMMDVHGVEKKRGKEAAK